MLSCLLFWVCVLLDCFDGCRLFVCGVECLLVSGLNLVNRCVGILVCSCIWRVLVCYIVLVGVLFDAFACLVYFDLVFVWFV